MKNPPIDFVVLWLDSTDPEWQKSLKEHKSNSGIYEDATDKRYRDWGLFKYWFRGVEKYAPWVNKVHLITCGHYPEWLDLGHPKLNFVRHEDYMPSDYLPTFSSHPIELNIHRIESLSEHFVYFNDDMFIKAPLEASDFFKNGLPCDSGVMQVSSGNTCFSKVVFNSSVVMNKYQSKHDMLKSHPLKWFNPKYKKHLLFNILLLPWGQFTGFYDYHLPNAFLKSTLNAVWKNEYSLLHETSLRKFRHDLDVNQYIFRNWQLVNNSFHPISKRLLGDICRVGNISLDNTLASLNSKKKPLICLNDHDPQNLDYVIEQLVNSFERIFPDKSSFEI